MFDISDFAEYNGIMLPGTVAKALLLGKSFFAWPPGPCRRKARQNRRMPVPARIKKRPCRKSGAWAQAPCSLSRASEQTKTNLPDTPLFVSGYFMKASIYWP